MCKAMFMQIKISLQFSIFAGCAVNTDKHCIEIYFFSLSIN